MFSDIEHSADLAHRLRGEYPQFIEKYRSIVLKIVKSNNGQNLDSVGDRQFMMFTSADSAIRTSLAIQKEFQLQEWSIKIGMKIRLGIHTGIALNTESGYVGPTIHQTSRICDAAHGGQIIVSNATKNSISAKQNEEVYIKELGKVTLKDISIPVELYQVGINELKSDFPSLNAIPDEKQIVVLPFVNSSDDLELDYLGDGITEEIILALGKVRGLKVVSRSSAFSIKVGDHTVTQLGKILNVGAVVEGRVKKVKNRVQISVELIDAHTGFDIWSDKYDRPLTDIVDIQDEITIKIANALKCSLIPEENRSIKNRQSNIVEAYDYFLQGRRLYLQFSSNGMNLALQMFNKAIKSDINYALAYAGIADCYSFLFQHKEPSAEIINKAKDASSRAIELAPSLPDAYVSKGIVMALSLNFVEAERMFQYAIELDPSLFLAWFHYGRTCYAIGKLDKAARLFERANKAEPDDYQSLLLSAQAYDGMDCQDLAMKLRQRGLELANKRLKLNPSDTRALYFAANALALLKQRRRSIEYLDRALALDPGDSMLLYNAGCIYSLLGMKTEALDTLEKSYEAGLTLSGWYENDANLNSLRNHPRFIKLMGRIKSEK
jgi:adenylate cyclase